MPARRATIRDVAEAAGVSTTTVSDALAGRGRMAAATRERVQEAADAIGYVASAAARNLRLGRSGSVGLYVPTRAVGFEYYVHLAQGAAEAALGHGLALTLVPAWDRPDQLRALHLDGVIVSDPALGDAVLDTLRSMPMPMVTCERDLAPAADVAAVVQSDHVAAMRELVEHLVGAGAERLAVIAPTPETSFGRDVRAACARPGVEIDLIDVPLAFRAEHVVEAMQRLRDDLPDAVVAVPDGAALHLLQLLVDDGLRVPEDLLLASYVDAPALRTSHPTITAVDIDPRQTGKLAVEALVGAIETGTATPARATVPVTLEVRESTTRLGR